MRSAKTSEDRSSEALVSDGEHSRCSSCGFQAGCGHAAECPNRTNEAIACGKGHHLSPTLRCTLATEHDGVCMYSIEAVLAACAPPAPRADNPMVWTFPHRRADGWPLCPQCGDDELFSSNIPATEATIAGCYACNWKPDPQIAPPTLHKFDGDHVYEAGHILYSKRKLMREAKGQAVIDRALRRISERMGLLKMYEHDPVGFVGALETDLAPFRAELEAMQRHHALVAEEEDIKAAGAKATENVHAARAARDRLFASKLKELLASPKST